jgi:hypothetical protein
MLITKTWKLCAHSDQFVWIETTLKCELQHKKRKTESALYKFGVESICADVHCFLRAFLHNY